MEVPAHMQYKFGPNQSKTTARRRAAFDCFAVTIFLVSFKCSRV